MTEYIVRPSQLKIPGSATGGVKKNGEVLAQWSSRNLKEYRVANINKSTPIQNLAECWVPPIAPFFKVNVYGAVFAAQQEAGQVVICNDNGQVVAALSQKKKKRGFSGCY